MIVFRMVFLFFVLASTILTVVSMNKGNKRWGPYYYVYSKGALRNTVQPAYEMNAYQAFRRGTYLEAYYDNRGWILKVLLRSNRKEIWKKEYIHNKHGRVILLRTTQGFLVDEYWIPQAPHEGEGEEDT